MIRKVCITKKTIPNKEDVFIWQFQGLLKKLNEIQNREGEP